MKKRYARFTAALSVAIAAFWSCGVQANSIGMWSLENPIYSFGGYSSLVGMGKDVQQKLIDDHFLF
ncbi:hypothetical protein WKI45_13935 [Delftia tsuruhatensis]